MARPCSISEVLGGAELWFLERQLGHRLRPRAELVAHVEAHRRAVREAHARDPRVDVARSDEVADALVALLWRVHEGTPRRLRELVQGAAVYYCCGDDAYDDVQGVLGFDDDLRVVRAVEQVLDATCPEPMRPWGRTPPPARRATSDG